MSKVYKPLTPHEQIAVDAVRDGGSFKDAYQTAFKNSLRWGDTVLALKIRTFFGSKRIKLFLDVALGEVEDLPVVIDRDEIFKDLPRLLGRPTSFYPELTQEILDYFDIEPFESIEYTNDKTGVLSYATKLNYFPTLAGFAAKIKISRITLYKWANAIDHAGSLVNPEFSEAVKICKDLQENLLVTNTLLGEYQPSFAIFTAKNLLGWKDSCDLNVTAETEKPLAIIDKDMTAEQAGIIYRESIERKS